MYKKLRIIKEANFFLQLGLNLGYYQIAMHEIDIRKTVILIMDKHYNFTRMLFGPINALKSFRRNMQELLRNIDYV